MIVSQLEIIDQGISYLESVSKENYTAILSPNFISSAGSHMRHIIDHYQAIISGLNDELIDYDIRERGSNFELSPAIAIEKLTQIAHWIKSLTEGTLNKHIMLSTEVSVSNKNIQKVQTSVARELVFAGSHAVHHYAMIAQITFAQQKSAQVTSMPEFTPKLIPKLIPESFGLAPATATFMRQNSKEAHEVKKAISQ